MIPLHLPTITGQETEYLNELIQNPHYFKERHYSKQCVEHLRNVFGGSRILLTNSCTQALELAAILMNIQPGDEVIMSSFTYVSTPNAFVLRGGVPVFVDIDPRTMNIDAALIEDAITARTKAIVPVHYGGVSCDLDAIQTVAEKYNLIILEDAAHAFLAKHRGRALGKLGSIGCISFDYVKNVNCGEGGIVVINDEMEWQKVEEIYENGTNRAAFLRGEVEQFIWKNLGSNFYPSDLTGAFLYPQLLKSVEITEQRIGYWNLYFQELQALQAAGVIELPRVPEYAEHNAHIFYIKTRDFNERKELMAFLKKNGVVAAFHYIPLHSTDFGKSICRFSGKDVYTTSESERLLRLPLYHNMEEENIERVVSALFDFFGLRR